MSEMFEDMIEKYQELGELDAYRRFVSDLFDAIHPEDCLDDDAKIMSERVRSWIKSFEYLSFDGQNSAASDSQVDTVTDTVTCSPFSAPPIKIAFSLQVENGEVFFVFETVTSCLFDEHIDKPWKLDGAKSSLAGVLDAKQACRKIVEKAAAGLGVDSPDIEFSDWTLPSANRAMEKLRDGTFGY